MSYDPTGGYPTLAAIRTWLRVAATSVSDTELDHVAGAEQQVQQSMCSIGDATVLPDPLYQAILRRVGRHLAAKGAALGLIGQDAEYGPMRLSRWDSETERLEGPYRIQVLA